MGHDGRRDRIVAGIACGSMWGGMGWDGMGGELGWMIKWHWRTTGRLDRMADGMRAGTAWEQGWGMGWEWGWEERCNGSGDAMRDGTGDRQGVGMKRNGSRTGRE